mmetsp:Transcript_54468/g.80852  ORF Transcript_54468/g.80852 Transcript_54468/m.80852 type:complete len:452 (-) Transcript_54468:130-1485(-)
MGWRTSAKRRRAMGWAERARATKAAAWAHATKEPARALERRHRAGGRRQHVVGLLLVAELLVLGVAEVVVVANLVPAAAHDRRHAAHVTRKSGVNLIGSGRVLLGVIAAAAAPAVVAAATSVFVSVSVAAVVTSVAPVSVLATAAAVPEMGAGINLHRLVVGLVVVGELVVRPLAQVVVGPDQVVAGADDRLHARDVAHDTAVHRDAHPVGMLLHEARQLDAAHFTRLGNARQRVQRLVRVRQRVVRVLADAAQVVANQDVAGTNDRRGAGGRADLVKVNRDAGDQCAHDALRHGVVGLVDKHGTRRLCSVRGLRDVGRRGLLCFHSGLLRDGFDGGRLVLVERGNREAQHLARELGQPVGGQELVVGGDGDFIAFIVDVFEAKDLVLVLEQVGKFRERLGQLLAELVEFRWEADVGTSKRVHKLILDGDGVRIGSRHGCCWLGFGGGGGN